MQRNRQRWHLSCETRKNRSKKWYYCKNLKQILVYLNSKCPDDKLCPSWIFNAIIRAEHWLLSLETCFALCLSLSLAISASAEKQHKQIQVSKWISQRTERYDFLPHLAMECCTQYWNLLWEPPSPSCGSQTTGWLFPPLVIFCS